MGQYSPAKTGDIPQFLKQMDNKHNSLNLAAKICSDICPWTLSVPRSSQFSWSFAFGKIVRFSEQIMSADKYPGIFSRQMRAIVYMFSGSYSVLLRDKNAAVTYINCTSQTPGSSPGQGFDCFSCSLGCNDVSRTENQSLLRQFQYMTSSIQKKTKTNF